MIEFKADCGHTVRARDEDGGGVVRCSYCGKPANVPEGGGDDLDFLFNDVEQNSGESKRGKRRRGKSKRAAKRIGARGEFNPFAVVLRLCYAALLIIIVVVVGNQFVIPLFQKGGVQKRTTGPVDLDQANVDGRRRPRGASKPREKLRPGTLYVNSTPAGSGVRIFCIEAGKAPTEGRIHRAQGVTICMNGVCKPRGHGMFIVEVAIPVRHPDLRLGPRFNDFRRKLRDASKEKDRHQAANEYFIPDDSVLLVDTDGSQQYFVRQYRQERRRDRGTAVRALFLPRIPKESGRGYSVDKLIRGAFIPEGNQNEFDVADVSDELKDFFKIEQPERDAIVEALRRIGVISYRTPDGKTTLFEIDEKMLGDRVIIDAAR
ncbi:MAG: hypothetical protein IH987_13240 [Planctomycetes bacterium]|nr:hypothetical protein [Planctomycetota bacterium]